MHTIETDSPFIALDLPREFKDLEALVHADLAAIVNTLSEQARERMLLTRHGYQQLQEELWNGLTAMINESMEPLTAERR